MAEVTISPSILGWESNLDEEHLKQIKAIVEATAWLHIDHMDPNFFDEAKEPKFESDKIAYLESRLKGLEAAPYYDFHLMNAEPDDMIEYIISKFGTLRDADSPKAGITLHREAYRRAVFRDMARSGNIVDGVWQPYVSKDTDLLHPPEGTSNEITDFLREANKETGKRVLAQMENIRKYNLKAGLALEPYTSLDNITPELAQAADLFLLMSVVSGAGGQGYIPEVTPKIVELHKQYPGKIIQVDGGINDVALQTQGTDLSADTTMGIAIKAGARNLVMGSTITKHDDPAQRAIYLLGVADRYASKD